MRTERHIVSILREVARERGLAFETFSQDWIVRLSRVGGVGGVARWVFGYDFDINSCVAQLLAKDKAGASLMLEHAGVPHVGHVLFNHPQTLAFVPDEGTWAGIHRYAAAAGWDVVVKPNDGSGGVAVTRATTPPELEDAVHKLLMKVRAIALSPYLEIADEYRTVVLRGQCLLVYRKVRPAVVGDGRSTRLELVTRALQAAGDGAAAAKALGELGRRKVDLGVVVPAGEPWRVNWKHNLALGSRVELMPASAHDPKRASVADLAVLAAAAVNLQFGSVDVVETAGGAGGGGGLLVLELNAGVMMESFVGLAPDGRGIARRIYAAAVDAAFGP